MTTLLKVILAVHVLAYVVFLEGLVYEIGGRKVYLLDLALLALIAGFATSLLTRPRAVGESTLSSGRLFGALFVWGALGIVRGIPTYGLSAVGESRHFVLQMLFYFFTVRALKSKRAIGNLLAFSVIVIALMPPVRAVLFYGAGHRDVFVGTFQGSEVLSTQAGYRFIQAGEAILVACAGIGMLVFHAALRAMSLRMNILAWGLLAIVALVQVRSAWVASAGGLMLGVVIAPRLRRAVTRGIYWALGSVLLLVPVFALSSQNWGWAGRFWDSLAYSASFLRNPVTDETALWRLTVWQQAATQLHDSLLFGRGLGGYFLTYDPVGAEVLSAFHNGYLVLVYRLGLIGLALMGLAITAWFREVRSYVRQESDRRCRAMAKTMMVVVIMTAVFAFFYDFVVAFWVCLGVGSALVRQKTVRNVRGRRFTLLSLGPVRSAA